MMLEIPDDIAGRLKALAERQDRGIDDVLYDMLKLHDTALEVAKGRKYATAADLGRNAAEFAKAIEREGIEGNQKSANTAENSRQVLREIYAEKFRQRADS